MDELEKTKSIADFNSANFAELKEKILKNELPYEEFDKLEQYFQNEEKKEISQLTDSINELSRNSWEYNNGMFEDSSLNYPASAGSSKGNTKRLAASAYTVNHSSIPSISINDRGFTTKIILGLLIAFASGAIISTIYIFMNLGNLTFTL